MPRRPFSDLFEPVSRTFSIARCTSSYGFLLLRQIRVRRACLGAPPSLAVSRSPYADLLGELPPPADIGVQAAERTARTF